MLFLSTRVLSPMLSRRTLLIFLATTAWLGAGAAARQEPASPWESAIAAFEAADRALPPPAQPVLFVGSSTIRMWNLKESFPGLDALNRGFGGSTFADLDRYFDRVVVPYKPRIVVVYSGDNDIAKGDAPEKVAADYGRFHEKLRKAFPMTPVVFLAIKPSLARWELYGKMKEANALIIGKWSKEDPAFFTLDMGAAMLGDDGKPRAELFVKDGLHLSDEGYRMWSRAVLEMIEDLIPEREF